MEIRNLVTFIRIAEVRNFSKAAEQLGYSQSAVTMQIKQLEKELHAQLFERIGRQVKLTQAGERLLPHALDILKAVSQAENIVREPGENVKFFRNIFLRNFKRFSEEPLFYPYYIVFQCKNLLLSKYKIFFYTIL